MISILPIITIILHFIICPVLPGSVINLAAAPHRYWSLTAQCVKKDNTYSDWEMEDGVKLTETSCLAAHSCQTKDLEFPLSVRLAPRTDHLGQALNRNFAYNTK